METKFKQRLVAIRAEETELVNECLAKIAEIVEPYGILAFGNTEISVIGGKPHIRLNGAEWLLLYSEDGYDRPDDIANWADIISDVDACYKSGRTSYSVMWNI